MRCNLAQLDAGGVRWNRAETCGSGNDKICSKLDASQTHQLVKLFS